LQSFSSIGQTPANFTVNLAKLILNNFNNSIVLGGAIGLFELNGTIPFGMTLLQMTQFLTYLQADIMPKFVDPLFNNKIFIGLTPYEILFNRVDPIIELVSPANAYITGILSDANQTHVETKPADIWTTGKNDSTRAGFQVTYLGDSMLEAYSPPQPLTGGSCIFNGPNHMKNKPDLTLFESNSVRDYTVKFNETYTFKGISLDRYRFDLTSAGAQAGATYHNPSTFILNVTYYYGAPLFLSLPNFLHSDPSITNDRLDGVTQNETRGDLSFGIEPTSGLNIDVSAGLQGNVFIPPSPNGFNRYSMNVQNNTYYPVSYILRSFQLSDSSASQLKKSIYGALEARLGLTIGLIALGGLMVIGGIIGAVVSYKKRKNDGDYGTELSMM